ncbi:MAG: ABC transporter permease [Candidatus Aenigmatarchaeota archaeon]
MNFIEILRIIFKNLQRRKLRSFLTILGIIIGSAVFISIFNLGKATEESIVYNLERNLGSNVITILPIQMGRRAQLTMTRLSIFSESDVDKIKRIDGVENAYGVFQANLQVRYEREEYRLLVYGIYGINDWVKTEAERIGISEGRFIEKEGEVILGYRASKEFFKKEINIGDRIFIANKSFRVVGILNEAGGLLSSFDRAIFLSIKDLKKIQNTNNQLNSIVVKVKNGYDIEDVGNNIYNLLLRIRNEKEGKETFSVITPSFYREIVSETVSILSVFLLAIAFVSIIVGSIGISNTMFTSVLERTKEIGILKAIGAKNRDILKIFLLESAVMGLIGSIIGCLFGIFLSLGLQQIIVKNFETMFLRGKLESILVIDYNSIFIALMIGFLCGTIAGYFPAKRASKLETVEALRYE